LQPTVDAALGWLNATHLQPETVILGLTRRGEHGVPELQQLQRQLPLANTIALVGSWCEGETRSGTPANGRCRVYWHQFCRWASGELFPASGGGGLRGEPYLLQLPKTVTENERTLIVSKRPLPPGHGRVAINTLQRVDYEALARVCGTAGYEACWCQDATEEMIGQASCVLWDRRGLQGWDLKQLLAWRRLWEELPLIATIGFPREQDYQLVSQRIVQAIVGKPFGLAELARALQESSQSQVDVGWAA